MFRKLASLVVLFGLVPVAVAQKPTKVEVPKEVSEQFKTAVPVLKETPGEVVERAPGEFQKVRSVASGVKVALSKSDYDDKPFKAVVSWNSQRQETKIFGEKAKAEKCTEWLAEGRTAGAPENILTAPQRYEAVFFYVGEKWVLEDLAWSNSAPTGAAPVRGAHAGPFSVKAGLKSPWTAVLGELPAVEKK